MNSKSLSERYEDLRIYKSLSIRQLAQEIGCNEKTISFYENGSREMPRNVIMKYAEYFNVSADYLLGLSDVPSFDMDIKTICQKTGLSQSSAILLQNLTTNKDTRYYKKVIDAVNEILSDDKLLTFLPVYFYYEMLPSDKENNDVEIRSVANDIHVIRYEGMDQKGFESWYLTRIQERLMAIKNALSDSEMKKHKLHREGGIKDGNDSEER